MSQEKEEAILSSAITLFAGKGFDNTSTTSISAAAGIGSGTLFKYYKNKAELIIAAYFMSKMEMATHIKSGLNPNVDFEDLLYHVWGRAIDWSLKNPEQQKFIMQVKASRYANADADVSEKIQQEFLFLIVALKGAQEMGKVDDLPLELIELTFSTFFNMAVEYITASGANSKRIKEQVFSMMMNSLRPNQYSAN